MYLRYNFNNFLNAEKMWYGSNILRCTSNCTTSVLTKGFSIPHICHGHHGRCPCNFFWQVYIFPEVTQKIDNFTVWFETLCNITQCVQCNTVYNLVHCVIYTTCVIIHTVILQRGVCFCNLLQCVYISQSHTVCKTTHWVHSVCVKIHSEIKSRDGCKNNLFCIRIHWV